MPKTQGQYKGKDIYAGSDAYITQQMQAIDAASVPAPTQPKPISASAAPTQAMQVQQFTPTPPPPIDPVVQQLQAQQQQAQAAIEAGNKEQGTIVQSVEALLNQQGQMGARQAQLEQEAGLPELQKNLSNINAQINQTVGQAFSEQQAAEGRLAPTFAISGDQQRIEREKAVRTFGLSAAAAAIQGNIGLAQDNIKRAIDSEFSGIESRLKYQQVLLDLNRDKLTGAQRDKADAIQQLLQERKEQVAQQRVEKERVFELVTAAAQKGAPSHLLSQAMQGDYSQALFALQPYVQEPQEVSTQVVKLDNGQTVLLNTQTGEVIKNVGGATPPAGTPGTITDQSGNSLQYGTPEYLLARLAQTAGSKTKLVASEREQLNKFSNVVDLTSNLMGSLDKTTNDPVLGYLKSLNPYDFDARAVNAQVTALVPSVARGLYGEVGVLTDQDIARYLGTLPNLKSTTEQNKFIAVMTLANARRSYENTLLSAASAGLNVSGYADSYKAMNQKLSQLESELGIGGTPTYNEKETQDLQFSNTSGSSGGTISNAWNWAKGLFGF